MFCNHESKFNLKNLNEIQELQQFDNLEFIAREVVEGFITGLHRSPFHGFSVEFAEHRLYNQGESTKHIDWKLFARTEKLFVKRYEEETNLRSHIIIDTSSSMLYPSSESLQNKLAFSVYASAALINLLRKQRDAVSLTFFNESIELQTPARVSPSHANLLFSYLNNLLSSGSEKKEVKTSTAQALHLLAESFHKRSLVILFSDMLSNENKDEVFAALQHLRHNKHEVILFHVTSHQDELQFDFQNRPYRFVDLETGESIKLNPNEVREVYKNRMNNYLSDLKLRCGQYQIDLIEADIAKNFDQVLLAYLIKRSKLI